MLAWVVTYDSYDTLRYVTLRYTTPRPVWTPKLRLASYGLLVLSEAAAAAPPATAAASSGASCFPGVVTPLKSGSEYNTIMYSRIDTLNRHL